MKQKLLHISSGQVVVVSVVVMGFLALSFVLAGAKALTDAFQARTAFENKAMSAEIATGCAEQAMNRLGLDATYGGNETVSVASSTCSIRPIVSGNGTWTIETWAQVGDQYTRYRVILSSRLPITVGSWTEVVGF